MPWYKLFDETTKSWDGVLRPNVNSKGGTWYPRWVAINEELTEEIEKKANQMGPYFTRIVKDTEAPPPDTICPRGT